MNIFLVRGMHLASLLPHGHVFQHGLAGPAIIGQCQDHGTGKPHVSPAHFVRNNVFVEFMHDLIAREVPRDSAAIEKARAQSEGYLRILDRRTPQGEQAPQPEDVIGEFQISEGAIVPKSYRRNPTHTLLSHSGWFKLDDYLEECLIRELMALSPDKGLGLTARIGRWFRGS